jgi:hypothetical protein
MKEPQFWQEEDLVELIRNKHEETIELDYKRADALQSTDGKKTEISKDVSAFANSIGGTILYGMEESADEPHSADRLSPIDLKQIPKEWLEQVINSRIQPRISGLLINPVEIKSSAPTGFAYVVVIPESTTAHQASDKKYYKRFNFQTVAMEDYEIRQTMNRASRPAYKVDLLAKPIGKSPDNRVLFRFEVTVENQSDMVGHDVSAVIFAPVGRLVSPDANSTSFKGIQYTRITGVFMPGNAFLDAIPTAYPLVRYQLSFPKDIYLSHEAPPFTLVVKVFDHFGLSLTAYHNFGFCGFTLKNEIHASKRNPSAFTVGTLE